MPVKHKHELVKPDVTDENTAMLSKKFAEMEAIGAQLPVRLPELPEIAAQEVYEAIVEGEKKASPDLTDEGYVNGSAKSADELEITDGEESLFTAEHATYQIRDGAPKIPDTGSAGLATILSDRRQVGAIISLGKQTGDANYDSTHHMKDVLSDQITSGAYGNTVSIHQMQSGKFKDLTDTRPHDVLIGVGNQPSLRTLELAEAFECVGSDLGLRVMTNTQFVKMSEGQPVVRPNGEYAYGLFKGAASATTRSHSQATAEALGLQMANVQVELSELLTYLPKVREIRRNSNGSPDMKRIYMGCYLGYLIFEKALTLDRSTQSVV